MKPPSSAHPVPATPPVYSEATEKVFRRALEDLEKRLPDQHVALVALVESRTFHDAAVLERLVVGGAQ